jgi:streptogramin lyase
MKVKLILITAIVGTAATGLAAAAPTWAATITEFPLATPNSNPQGITAGPDGALWFVEQGSGLGQGDGRIGRIATSGKISEFPIPTPTGVPYQIVAGPEGALWFTDVVSRIGRITTGGDIARFAVPGTNHRPVGITAGSDGALWFTDTFKNSIGRMTTTGTFSEFPIPTPCCGPSGIAAGPDGALWFTESEGDGGEIGRITTGGAISEFPLPTGTVPSSWITAGPDGALWFTENDGIGRMTTDGRLTEFPLATPNSNPQGITAGSDGALWFTESSANKIGRITTTGGVADFRVPTPSSVPVGIATGDDGALWFTEQRGNRIGRITTDQPLEDSVDGTLYTEPPCDEPGCTPPRYVFGASSTASGEHPLGTVSYLTGQRAGTTFASGSVTCLHTDHNRATVGVNFGPTEPSGFPPARGALIFLEDNGPADADRFAVQDLPAGTAPSACPTNPPAGTTLGPGYPPRGAPDDPGVVVTDVPAVPSSREECRHGGWRNFPQFKNQGQCIAFVKHGP